MPDPTAHRTDHDMTDPTTLVSDLLTQINDQLIIGSAITGAAKGAVATLVAHLAPKVRERMQRLTRREGPEPRRNNDRSGTQM